MKKYEEVIIEVCAWIVFLILIGFIFKMIKNII
jgi:hypothetical protein